MYPPQVADGPDVETPGQEALSEMAKSQPAPPGAPDENRLLTALPRDEYERLIAHMVDLPLAQKDVLYRANGPVSYVFFPRGGVASVVMVMQDGSSIEVGTVGKEGMVGVPAFLGSETSPTQIFMQVAGTVRRLPVDAFRDELKRGGKLYSMLQRYTQATINTITQSAACNHLHAIEERLARWLLTTQDRVEADNFFLTQEFLAVMLGVRRPTVTVAAGLLQKQGLIQYHRGKVEILNRPGLETAACECYRAVRDEFERLLGWAG